jgi:hypothetical protein
MGERLSVFLGHPDLQGLPAVLEVPGPDNHGPDADEIRKTKDLWKRGVGSATRRSPRKRGTSARRPAARKTRG